MGEETSEVETAEEIEEYELVEEEPEKPEKIKKPEKPVTKITVKEKDKEKEQDLNECPYCESEDIRYDYKHEVYLCLNCGKGYIYEETES